MRALITGVLGQDGVYLARLLTQKGYTVYGIDKPEKYGKTPVGVLLQNVVLTDKAALNTLLDDINPDEIYHLAAFVTDSEYRDAHDNHLFDVSITLHVHVAEYFLSWIKQRSPQTRFFYASTCHVFDREGGYPQTESSSYNPKTFYALTKLFGQQLCRYYRETYDIFASVGILYNHESPLRSNDYVTKKIAISAAQGSSLVLRNLAARVDWGCAEDVVEAMHAIVQHHTPDEFIIASGVAHSVKEFVIEAFSYAGRDWLKYVQGKEQDNNSVYVGDIAKLTHATGWKPKTDFYSLVRLMVDAEISL